MTDSIAEDWRELSEQFAKLSQEESKEVAPGSHPYIDAYVHDVGDGRHWTVCGPNSNRAARFEALASRAGRLLGEIPQRGYLVDAWLERLCLDLLQQRKEGATVNLRSAEKPGDPAIIDCVCLESATFCARLEAKAHASSEPGSSQNAQSVQTGRSSAQQLPGLVSLSRVFGAKLWDVKTGSAGRAGVALKAAKTVRQKKEVLDAHLVAWREDSGDLIREYFPKYIELGSAYSGLLDRDIVGWAEDQVWSVLEGQCGVARYGDLHPRPSKSVVWWLAVAIDDNFGVNLPKQPRYRAPKWLAANLRETEELVADISQKLSGRFFGVLMDEIDAARVRVAIAAASEAQSGTIGTTRDSEQSDPKCPFSDDFRSVAFRGQIHLLTPSQARMAEILWEALRRGHPAVSKQRLLSTVQSSEVRDTWKSSELWNTLIVSKRKGTYQLNPDLFSSEAARNTG
jgi:hypothetical protein